MSHANAALTPLTRLRLARLVVEAGWTYAAAAKMFMVVAATAKKWADRYRAEGPAGMADRSSRPHRSPTKTTPAGGAADRGAAVAPPARPGPDRRPARHAGLDRARGAGAVPDQPAVPHRPGHRRTAAPLRARPSRLADPRRRHQVRQHPRRRRARRYVGRAAGRAQQRAGHRPPDRRNAATTTGRGSATPSCTPSSTTTPGSPTPRSAPTRRPPPRSASCTARSRGSPSTASPSNECCPTTASAYRSYAWRDACAELGITHKRTRPYRPQTNGKIERFHRTLADGWAYARLYDSETERRTALPELAPLLQSPPSPLRHRRPATGQPD